MTNVDNRPPYIQCPFLYLLVNRSCSWRIFLLACLLPYLFVDCFPSMLPFPEPSAMRAAVFLGLARPPLFPSICPEKHSLPKWKWLLSGLSYRTSECIWKTGLFPKTCCFRLLEKCYNILVLLEQTLYCKPEKWNKYTNLHYPRRDWLSFGEAALMQAQSAQLLGRGTLILMSDSPSRVHSPHLDLLEEAWCE